MDSKKSPIDQRWRNAIVLFLGIFIVCTIIAWVLTGVVPNDMKWFGIYVPIAIATIGTLAGVAAGLCVIILIELYQRRP